MKEWINGQVRCGSHQSMVEPEHTDEVHFVIESSKTKHIRFNDLTDPIPRDTDHACVFESDIPVVVQHTRLDSRQAENALLSTMAFVVE